jgi:AraC-like DNA-binding protein
MGRSVTWRDGACRLAATLLSDGLLGAHEVAARVGYDSEAAISRAFKRRYTGQPPRVFAVVRPSVT